MRQYRSTHHHQKIHVGQRMLLVQPMLNTARAFECNVLEYVGLHRDVSLLQSPDV
ncbi:MAG: hypothetical protein Q8L60_04500 [Gammaproteobacteria bacterium]|nr:hypothetical protein [Gammaproteobacteria bacterium]MDP2140398.1 hypothetical protein [Gammaproteobacteria bacterium]MDP2349437.1 hypothetical protein [Gammaproteobacteria bacterium]